ncbi:MAG: leucyl/phenylalanyl-tRNA--protein transferase [Alphaproteobacteria bacterium]
MSLTPELLLAAYAQGYFPMGRSREDVAIDWYDPPLRGVLPLDDFHVPRRLRRTLAKSNFTLTTDQAFADVMRECARARQERPTTWINDTIIAAYVALHQMGHAHSVEVWTAGLLVGGLYGVSLGGAFFGESMFSHQPNASKMALVKLVEILREAGYTLLDTQYVNPHLRQFGAIAIPRADYKTKLENALKASPNPSSLFSTASVRKGLASASSARVN